MVRLTVPQCKAIIAQRDSRYDGRFYYGVQTTGIYCRPTCPAKPKSENILIFHGHREAVLAGYRACLRCRPDIAPGLKRPDEAKQHVSDALHMIHHQLTAGLTSETLAKRFGMTSRHLRRLFDRYLGASPGETLTRQRLQRAKLMVQTTASSITDIAFAVGFRSLRRFNEAFKHAYQVSPSTFRRRIST